MRNTRWLRASLASLTVCGLALSAFVVACGDDDTGGGGVIPGVDSGPDGNSADTGTSDTGTPDTGSPTDGGADADADATSGPEPAKLTLINAATDFGPNNPIGALRVCYQAIAGATEVWAQTPPLPNRSTGATPFPGLFIGTGGPVPSTGTKLETLAIRPYLLNAFELEQRGLGSTVTDANEKFCEDLLKPTADAGGEFIEGKDFWKLPDIPVGALKNDKSYFLVLTGCTKDSTAGADKCGADWTDTDGNLKANVLEVTTTADADKIGFQFVNASPNLGATLAAIDPSLKVDPVLLQEGDAGTAKHVAGGEIADKTLSPLAQYSDFAQATASLRPNLAAEPLTFPFDKIKLLSYGGTVPANGDYTNGRAFTIVALGDPAADPDGGNGGATFNTKFFHFIVLPNDPIVK